MGSSLSCVPQNNFIRRNSSRLFRRKNPQEGQVKSNSIINILCTVSPRQEMSAKDLETIQNIKWEPPFAYDPSAGWKKSSINVKNYGRLIHSSKVQFRFLHCQSVHDCFLDLFQTHLHFVSNTTTGLTYQGTLPLQDLTVCKLLRDSSDPETNPFAFQISGVGLNPIIVFCSCQEELDTWLGHLREHVEGNGGTVVMNEPKTYARVKNPESSMKGREDLRNSVKNEPIYEWEGSQRESLGAITYVTKVKLQHLPCQEQYDRLLVMYPATIIILSEESDGLFYKGKLPLNSISVTTPCKDVKPNTFMIEGKMINPIVVTCLDENEYCTWISHFNTMHIPVQIPPPPVYDIIYTPTKTKAPELDQWDHLSRHEHRHSQRVRRSHELSLRADTNDLMSPGYAAPFCYTSDQSALVESHPPFFHSRPSSMEVQLQARMSGRSDSVSSRTRPALELQRRPSQRSIPPSHDSGTSADPPLSPIYNTPYGPVQRHAPFQWQEKAPLVKSNSWSVPHTDVKQQLSGSKKNSDMCPSRKVLSPLYDEPWTPGIHISEDNYVKPAMSRQCREKQEAIHLLPSSFRLQTPPSGRRKANVSHAQQEVEPGPAPQAGGYKLLSPPTAVLRQKDVTHMTVESQFQTPVGYSQEDISYLKPAEPDDQEADYDNIWDFDCDSRMSQQLPVISAHRTPAH